MKRQKLYTLLEKMPKKAPEIIFKSENDSENSDDIFYDDVDQYLI